MPPNDVPGRAFQVTSSGRAFNGNGLAAGAMAPPTMNQIAAIPTATGIKSLRIAIPKSGRAFNFTRVLNLGGEPPIIRLSLMRSRAFVLMRTFFQVIGFLVGLGIFWIQWRHAQPGTLWLAVGAALTLLATADLLVSWRLLGVVLITAVPALLLLGVIWLVWGFAIQARARRVKRVSPHEPPSTPPPQQLRDC